jgi:ferrous iron transport protein A
MPARSLCDLPPRTPAVVRGLCGDPLLRERFVELGFTPGQRVEVLSCAAFDGPLQVRVRGGTIAVRRDEACCVELADGLGALPAGPSRKSAAAAA